MTHNETGPRHRARALARSAPSSGRPYNIIDSASGQKTSDDASTFISARANDIAHHVQDMASVKLKNATNDKAPAAMRTLVFEAKDRVTDMLRGAFQIGTPMADLRAEHEQDGDPGVMAMISILQGGGDVDAADRLSGKSREKMGSIAHVSYILNVFDAFMDELVSAYIDLFVWVLEDEHAAEYFPRALERKILVFRTQLRNELKSWGLPA